MGTKMISFLGEAVCHSHGETEAKGIEPQHEHRKYPLHRCEAKYISLIISQWTSTETKSFQ